MTLQYTPYFFPLIIGGLISTGLAVFAWRYRAMPGAIPLTMLMGCVAWWSIGYAIQLSFIALRAKVIQSNINYIAILITPLAWFAFALQYSGYQKWLTRRNLILLSILPTILLSIIWTDSAHRWFRTDIQLAPIGQSFVVMKPTHGIAFWTFVMYAYPLILLGSGLILRNLIRSASVYRSQALVLTIGALAPLIANALTISNLLPLSGIDLTPLSFVITGLTTTFGIFRYQLLDVVPVARDMIVESIRDSVIVLDSRKRIVDLNPAARELLKHASAPIIGRPSREVFATWPELAEYAQDVIEAHSEITLGQGTGRLYFDLRISCLRDKRGRATGQLISLRDITTRKRTRGELEAILESIVDGVVVFDASGQATMANPTSAHLLGTPIDEIIGSNVEELLQPITNPEERAVIIAALESEAMCCPSLKIKWGEKTLSTSAAPVRLDSGEVIGNVAVFRDYTREAQVDRMKSTFVSIASHELRAPLTAILGYTGMLKEGVYGQLTDEQQEIMARVMANTSQMLSLSNNLLDQAQMQADKLTLKLTTFAPAGLLTSVREMMDVMARTKGLKLITHIAPDTPMEITGDWQRLQQILINLTNNAIKFTDEGTISLCAYSSNPGHWALAVSDTGCGISAQGQKIIFEPFQQEENVARKYGGAGLGLSIVKQLVKLMGGEIQLESEVGKGSTFTIMLPIQAIATV
jgi:PAS domain S-box-containing protein